MTQSSSVHKPLKVYVDENLPRQFAQAFNVIQQHMNKSERLQIEVLSMKEINEGADDVEWFEALKDENAVILTLDRKIQRQKHEKAAYMANGIGIFFMKQPNSGDPFWVSFKHLVKFWPDIKKICKKHKPPFAFKQSGVNRPFEEWK